MKIKTFILLIAFAAILTSIFTIFLYNAFIVEKIVSYNMTVRVDDHFGLAIDNESLNFGRIIPGQSVDKGVTFANPSNHNVKISIHLKGNISDWVTVSNYIFNLPPNENKNVTFNVLVPDNAYFGKYTGEAEILFRRSFTK